MLLKEDIVNHVSRDVGVTKALADRIVDGVYDAIYSGIVQDGEVRLHGIGTLKVKTLAARKFHSPHGIVEKGERETVRFKPSIGLVEELNS